MDMLSNRTILLVEDSPDDVELTLYALKKSNITNEVVITRDGEEALSYIFCTGAYEARDPNDLPVVILLDLHLPKIDGIGVLERLRENDRTKLMPVVVLTSSREEQDMLDSYRLGANSYVRKPVDFEQFAGAVKQLGMYWLLLNEPPPVDAVTPQSSSEADK